MKKSSNKTKVNGLESLVTKCTKTKIKKEKNVK